VFESWPDGNNHDIYRMAVNGSDIVRLTTDPGTDFSPAWRPIAR
jgi:Tol biopolymer transport system component